MPPPSKIILNNKHIVEKENQGINIDLNRDLLNDIKSFSKLDVYPESIIKACIKKHVYKLEKNILFVRKVLSIPLLPAILPICPKTINRISNPFVASIQ